MPPGFPPLNLSLQTMAKPEPKTLPEPLRPKYGFNQFAERINGRAAMVGFVLMILLELVTGQGLLSWLGLR